ncbi:MAG: hypothetical protein JO352_22390 [Chloroflexi bacterium]|nr:hypothetical protein [Chloroflexota bacterium]MBV9603009.1 hypothetical protein [Chloroflexota bacterium]
MPRREYVPEHALRPGRVGRIRGIIFQSDGASTVGRMFIRPFEAIDRWVVGVLPKRGAPSLAMHTGIHVELEDGRDFIAEQLVGSFYLDFRNGLNWTPYEQFTQRDRGGWDVTVPLSHFRAFEEPLASTTLDQLNRIEGHPFLGEDCTAFVERAFGGRRLYADSPLLRWLGIGVRVGDPALPLLKPDAALEQPARDRLQFDTIKRLPDALADADSPNVRLWLHRALPLTIPIASAFLVQRGWRTYSSGSRKSTPISRTARRFLR